MKSTGGGLANGEHVASHEAKPRNPMVMNSLAIIPVKTGIIPKIEACQKSDFGKDVVVVVVQPPLRCSGI